MRATKAYIAFLVLLGIAFVLYFHFSYAASLPTAAQNAITQNALDTTHELTQE